MLFDVRDYNCVRSRRFSVSKMKGGVLYCLSTVSNPLAEYILLHSLLP